MAVSVEWEVKATEFANCNCDFGCPCQFNAAPTHGDCHAIVGYQFHEGKFGDIPLSGLRAAAVYKWPGPIHEGNGEMQLVIDERATPAQRDGLLKIMSGEETEDMATMWWVFSAMSPTKLPPLFLPIDLAVDVDARTAHLEIPNQISAKGEPIRNPVTGDEHRVRIDFPQSFEFKIAEIGSGTSWSTGAIALDMRNSYGQFAHLHLSHKGRLD